MKLRCGEGEEGSPVGREEDTGKRRLSLLFSGKKDTINHPLSSLTTGEVREKKLKLFSWKKKSTLFKRGREKALKATSGNSLFFAFEKYFLFLFLCFEKRRKCQKGEE